MTTEIPGVESVLLCVQKILDARRTFFAWKNILKFISLSDLDFFFRYLLTLKHCLNLKNDLKSCIIRVKLGFFFSYLFRKSCLLQ